MKPSGLLTEASLEVDGVTFDGCAKTLPQQDALGARLTSLMVLLSTQYDQTKHCMLYWAYAICLNLHETVWAT